MLAYYGVDLLDLYRGRLSLRRVCVLVGGLPPQARLFRVGQPDGGWSRQEVLLLAVERRVTALWRDVVTALGASVGKDQLAAPVAVPDPPSRTPGTSAPEAPTSLRAIARWMRS